MNRETKIALWEMEALGHAEIKIEKLEAALKEITLKEGAFDNDHLQHAINTIKNMAGIAERALAGTYEPPPTGQGPTSCSPASACLLRELIEDELRDLWQWGYDWEPREESVRLRLDAIMELIEANA